MTEEQKFPIADGDEIYSHYGARCPYCGNFNFPESDSDYDECLREMLCDVCDREFNVIVNIDVIFTSWKQVIKKEII